MMDEIEVKSYRSPADDRTIFTTSISPSAMMEVRTTDAILHRIVELVAEKYVQENYPQLVAKIDQQAIANLVIAESGKKIAEEIRLTPPPPLVQKETQIYQRGVFGGMRRVR
jgi:hypothetical protein